MTLLQAEARGRFSYEPETGKFTDLKTGLPAGAKTPDGYLVVSFKGKMVPLHRLAFAWMLGTYPPKQVDHVNGVRSDNRWCNLRPATAAQNGQNRKPTSAHGYKGATLGADGRWRAHIVVDGVRKPIPGSFESAHAAHQAYKSYAAKYFGQFAKIVAPITGARPAQDDVYAARAQLDIMKKRRESIAQQLAEIDAAIEALELRIERAEVKAERHKKAAEAEREKVKILRAAGLTTIKSPIVPPYHPERR